MAKRKEFVPPTAEQVTEYAASCGYLISAGDFMHFYESNDWKDSNDRPIKNWKLKLRQVWFRNARKLEPVDGAPEGYETFYAMQGGTAVRATRWKDGKPYSDNGLNADLILQREYERQCGNVPEPGPEPRASRTGY